VSKIYDELKRAHQSKLSRDPVPLDLLASVIEKRSSVLGPIDLEEAAIPLGSDGEQARETVEVHETSFGATAPGEAETQLIADTAELDNKTGSTAAFVSAPAPGDIAKTGIQSTSSNETSPPLQTDTQPEPHSPVLSDTDRISLTRVEPVAPQLVRWPQPQEVVEVHKTSFEAVVTHEDTKTQPIADTAHIDNEMGSAPASFLPLVPSDVATTRIEAAPRSDKPSPLSIDTRPDPYSEYLGSEDRITRRAANPLWPPLIRWPILALVVVLLLVGLIRLRPKKSHESLPVAPDAGASSSLGLKSERSGSDWRVSWNRTAAPLEQAIGGHVSIRDGAMQKEFDLGPSELRNGSLIYSPVSDNVFLQFQLKYKDSRPAFSESVRIVAGAKSSQGAHPSGVNSPASNSSPLAVASAATPRVLPKKMGGVRVEPLAAEAEVNQLSRFESSPLPNNSHPTNPLPPSIPEANNQKPVSVPPVITPTVESIAAPEPKVSVASPPPALPANPPPAVTGSLEPAKLIRGESPVYPLLARRAGIRGSVEVRFRIGVSGEVHDAQVVSGSPVLARAALDAVKTWRYQPARRNGDPVDSEANATFQFRPD
jgi:protein TonB